MVTFLIPTIRVGPLHLDDPVHEEEGIAVRDHVQDPADVHRDASDALSGPAEPTGQRDIALVARLARDHVRLDPAADQREVAQDVARLVAHELVGPAQLAPDQTVVGEYQGRVEVGTLGQAPGPERLRLAHEAEGPRRAPDRGRTRPA